LPCGASARFRLFLIVISRFHHQTSQDWIVTRDPQEVRHAALAPSLIPRNLIGEAAVELGEAFRADPLFAWFGRMDERRHQQRTKFIDFILREVVLDAGEILRPSTGGAVAVWIDAEALRHQPLRKEIAFVPVVLGLTGIARLHRMLRLRKVLDRYHPHSPPHDYLFFLGVRPELQGKGIGSALLEASLGRLDARSRPAFLEATSEANRDLYLRFGFKITAAYRPAPGAPLLWAMWREPLSATADISAS
jgi:ribosomal protein S18 acetylase RimI-like enzyme